MNKPYEFENHTPNPPHPADGDSPPWIETGTIYVPIDMHIETAPVETGIFMPSYYSFNAGSLDMILYFHGNKDPKKKHVGQPIRTIWSHASYDFRTLVQASTKNFVLVAPTLGDTGGRAQGDFASKAGAIRFIDEVRKALFKYGPHGILPDVNQLVLAAHSGGGYYLKKVLPVYEAEYGVQQVWAFDCLYDTTNPVCGPASYRICQKVNQNWPAINHNHMAGLSVDSWRSNIQGTVEQTLGSWGMKGRTLRAYWNVGSGTAIRTANLALLAKLDRLAGTKVLPDFYSGQGADARPVTPPVRTPEHDDIPKLKMPECLAGL